MIHYHGGFGRSGHLVVTFLKARHAMVSFADPGHDCIIAEVCQSFAFDNGAYSMWKVGKKPDWEAYSKWVEKWAGHPGFDFAIIPDVIEGTEQENDDLIAWWQNSPRRYCGVPVWHMHESLERLERLSWLFPYRVALGSTARYSTVGSLDWWERMAQAMSAITNDEGVPRCKLHGLRMLNPKVFSYLPLASADSSNVARNIAYDGNWGRKGNPYCPMTEVTKAQIIAERIESHASANHWAGFPVHSNYTLIG